MENTIIRSYKDLVVWQKAMDLVVEIYRLTENYPKTEIYSLTSQLRRGSISVASNIAEGKSRGTKKDYAHFIQIAYSAGAEMETQIELSKRLESIKGLNFEKVDLLLDEVMRMLFVLIKRLKEPNNL